MKTQHYPVIGGVNPVIEHDKKAFSFGVRREGSQVEPDVVPADVLNRQTKKSFVSKAKARWCASAESSQDPGNASLDKPKAYRIRDLKNK